MESLVLRTELLYGHLLRIHEGNIAPQLVTENVLEIVRCLVKAIRDAADEIRYWLSGSCAFYWFIWKT